MNNNRYIASFYYPSATEATMETPLMADIPPAYQAEARQQQEMLHVAQQRTYMSAHQPSTPAPVSIHKETVEAAPVHYAEPVYSTYADHDSSIPVYYRMASTWSPLSGNLMAPPTAMSPCTVTVVDETVQQRKMEEEDHMNKSKKEAVPLDYFVQKATNKAAPIPLAAAPSQVRLATNGYTKMQNTFGEDASAYVFESMDEKLGMDNYKALGDAAALTSTTEPSEARSAAPDSSVNQAVHYSAASFPASSFNQNGGYPAEESSYLSFKNDVHAVYGQKTGYIQYNYAKPPAYSMVKQATVIQEPAHPEDPVKTTGSVSTASVEKSRFTAAIEESMTNLENEQQGAQGQQIDLRSIGHAFRPALMNADSAYHDDNLNDLVSCIQIN